MSNVFAPAAEPKKSRWQPPQQEKCQQCDKAVYATERVSVDKNVYHKACFRCSECQGVLNVRAFAVAEGRLFCKPHFSQLFKRKGNYTDGFKDSNGASSTAKPVATQAQTTSTSAPAPVAASAPAPVAASAPAAVVKGATVSGMSSEEAGPAWARAGFKPSALARPPSATNSASPASPPQPQMMTQAAPTAVDAAPSPAPSNPMLFAAPVTTPQHSAVTFAPTNPFATPGASETDNGAGIGFYAGAANNTNGNTNTARGFPFTPADSYETSQATGFSPISAPGVSTGFTPMVQQGQRQLETQALSPVVSRENAINMAAAIPSVDYTNTVTEIPHDASDAHDAMRTPQQLAVPAVMPTASMMTPMVFSPVAQGLPQSGATPYAPTALTHGQPTMPMQQMPSSTSTSGVQQQQQQELLQQQHQMALQQKENIRLQQAAINVNPYRDLTDAARCSPTTLSNVACYAVATGTHYSADAKMLQKQRVDTTSMAKSGNAGPVTASQTGAPVQSKKNGKKGFLKGLFAK